MKNKILIFGLVGLILGGLFVTKNVEVYHGNPIVKCSYYSFGYIFIKNFFLYQVIKKVILIPVDMSCIRL